MPKYRDWHKITVQKDGRFKYWSVYRQAMVIEVTVPDRELAAMRERDRRFVKEHSKPNSIPKPISNS
jgi:hypothetical protein